MRHEQEGIHTPRGLRVGSSRTVHLECATANDRKRGTEFGIASVYPYSQRCASCKRLIVTGEIFDRAGLAAQMWGASFKLMDSCPDYPRARRED